jgi:hypothetical protein
LFNAPAAAHACRSLVAFAFDVEPPGGMLPPSQLRHDVAGSLSADDAPEICPFEASHAYAVLEVDVVG